MTGTDAVQTTVPNAPFPPQRVRRRSQRAARRRRALTLAGCSLIVVGALVIGWLVWQFWGTNWVSERRHNEVVADVEASWGQGRSSADTEFGRATAILHVPRFGSDYAMPVLEGSSDEVLAAGIGHMSKTDGPGEEGNYVLAAHRITHGEPFADLPELRPGDLVHVETADATYTYVLDTGGTDLVVPFTASWVLDPFPRNPAPGGTTPPDDVGSRLITLLTCSEIFHTDNRSVVFGHLVERVPNVP